MICPIDIFINIIKYIDSSDIKTFKSLWGTCHNSKKACEIVSHSKLQEYNGTQLYVWNHVIDIERRSPGPPDYMRIWKVSLERPGNLYIDPTGNKPWIFKIERKQLLEK